MTENYKEKYKKLKIEYIEGKKVIIITVIIYYLLYIYIYNNNNYISTCNSNKIK